MSLDAELEEWRREWQSETSVPRDLRERAARQARWMRIAIAADIVVTVVIGGGVIALALGGGRGDLWPVAAGTWVFIAIAWTFRLAMNHGLWSPSAINTAAYVDLLIRRCRAKLVATIFCACFYAAEMVFILGWIYRHSVCMPLAEWLFFGSGLIDATWAVTLILAGVLVWYRRRKRAELNWLLGLGHS